MTKAKNWKPEGQSTVTPHLVLPDAAKAIEFYKKALGAEEVCRIPGPQGQIMHASIKIGESHVYLSDPCGQPVQEPSNYASLHVYVQDVDTAFKRAIDAGAECTMPVANMFWGARYGRFVDPFGQHWSLATHTEDVAPEDFKKRTEDMAQQPAHAK